MHRTSYWKTMTMALGGAGVSLLTILWPGTVSASGAAATVGLFLLTLALVASLLVASGGFVCLWRDARITSGEIDLFAVSVNQVPTRSLLSRVGLRFLLGPALRPGDIVQVRTLGEIQAALDADAALDGLPFMPEMKAYCGRTFRVHRRVDKINDMRHKTGLRRMHNAVTLTEVRCSGIHHGGCQAECQILWKDSWLRRLPGRYKLAPEQEPGHSSARSAGTHESGTGADTYVCQMTRLWEATRPMSRFDIRQDLRPLLSGNIGLGLYMLAILTRLFNHVQGLRGGAGFPFMALSTTARSTVSPDARFAANQAVCVRSREEIAETLVNSRNKGLWFDGDMVRFCGRPAVMRKHVDRIIHEATGKMVAMKTPCAMLENVVATGEFLRFCPQHEYIFWREVWLQPMASDVVSAIDSTSSG